MQIREMFAKPIDRDLRHIRPESLAIHQKPVYGFPVSLEVVNLIS